MKVLWERRLVVVVVVLLLLLWRLIVKSGYVE
jgi:hypothetical protein